MECWSISNRLQHQGCGLGLIGGAGAYGDFITSVVQWSGLGFFVVSLIGACSVIAAFLVALWGSGTAAVYSIVYLANASGRLEGGRSSARQRIHFD